MLIGKTKKRVGPILFVVAWILFFSAINGLGFFQEKVYERDGQKYIIYYKENSFLMRSEGSFYPYVNPFVRGSETMRIERYDDIHVFDTSNGTFAPIEVVDCTDKKNVCR